MLGWWIFQGRMLMNNEYNNRYNGLDGLRSIAALGIIAVHVAKNTGFDIFAFWYQGVICRLEVFVNLFFVISGFSMCCGYYEKIKNNRISMDDFYSKRYLKILPFFAILVIVDMIYSWDGIETLADAFADLTLAFAFLPDSSISIIGVGWTLGVIFAFYMLFPFFVYCLWNKKRAWLTFIVALLFNIFKDYFFAKENSYVLCNILIWAPYFVAGGLVYLYRNQIIEFIKKNRYPWLVISIVFLALWFVSPNSIYGIDISIYKTLITVLLWIMYAISVDSFILSNPVCYFVSGISFEIYLVHMLVYRAIEKAGIIHLVGNHGVLPFIVDYFFVVCGSIVVSVGIKRLLGYINFNRNTMLTK